MRAEKRYEKSPQKRSGSPHVFQRHLFLSLARPFFIGSGGPESSPSSSSQEFPLKIFCPPGDLPEFPAAFITHSLRLEALHIQRPPKMLFGRLKKFCELPQKKKILGWGIYMVVASVWGFVWSDTHPSLVLGKTKLIPPIFLVFVFFSAHPLLIPNQIDVWVPTRRTSNNKTSKERERNLHNLCTPFG